MGVFYTSKPNPQAAAAIIADALRQDPAKIPNVPQEANQRAEALTDQLEQKALSGKRLSVALGLLGGLLLAAIYTGRVEDLRELHEVLNHSFEILIGGISGLLTGEAIGSASTKP